MTELKSKARSNIAFRVVVIALLAQATAFYALSRPEYLPQSPPLAVFPTTIGPWTVAEEGVVDQETKDVLKADDLLNRMYARPSASPVNLFVAAFRSQRTGKAPHSPKNCLPGSGWSQLVNDRIHIDVPGRAPIEVNHYVVARGDSRSVVLYWYESRDRVIASEYAAKVFVVADSIRYNRSDTALVRIVVPISGADQATADQTARQFTQAVFPVLREYLPR